VEINLNIKRILILAVLLFLAACSYRQVPVNLLPPANGPQPEMGYGGTGHSHQMGKGFISPPQIPLVSTSNIQVDRKLG
jgi:hypothetical protein